MASPSAISLRPASGQAAEVVRPPESDLSSLLREYRQLQYRIDVAQRTIQNLAAIFGDRDL